MSKARVHVLIYGRVQGVFFRAFLNGWAQKLSLTGWVKNKSDGSVEAVFEGDKEQVVEMIFKCREGPLLAQIDDVQIDWQEYKGEFEDFQVV